MHLDLRVPIGLFFVSIGLIMAIFGLTGDPAIYQKSLGINVNLDWGIVELIFGSLMLAFGRPRRKIEGPVAAPAPTAQVPTLVAVTLPLEPQKPPVTHG